MNKILFIILLPFLLFSCKKNVSTKIDAQQIVDKSITVSGGNLYKQSDIAFTFRDREYYYELIGNKRILRRVFTKDSIMVVDIKEPAEFCRYQDESFVHVPDSLARAYSNSINSVHYFALLPYGLNDSAVKKKLLGETKIKHQNYYKVQVTFDKENGGDDFDDTYLYWFNKETFKPDYLAYEFHVNGGGIRFRKAYNERYINGIRFVDYKNYKPKFDASIYKTDSIFNANELELLSKIELKEIKVKGSL